VLAVIDVPSDQVSSSLPVIVADLPARIPTPLLRLAIERKIPVYVFVTGFRLDDGQRFLRIEPIGVPGSLEAVTQDLAARLDGLIRENPPAWHFWGEAERFFRA
jgi:lauroyl/myristoyl acyltransferase